VTLHTGLLRAEILRVRWTFTQAVPVIVVLFGLVAVRTSHVQTLSASSDWNGGVLAWLSMFPFIFALPVAALAGALAESRDVRWRGGGTWWRSTTPQAVSAARTIIESVWILVALLLLAAVIITDASVRGELAVPWRRIIGLVALLWITMTGATASGRILHRLSGRAALGITPVLAMAWSIAGAIRAERSTWTLEPWSWMPHTALPLVGTHGNSVPLNTDSPIWDWPVASGFAMCAALTVVLLAVAVLLGPRRTRGRRKLGAVSASASSHRPIPEKAAEKLPVTARASVLATAWRILPWRIWGGLAVALWLVMALTRAMFPDNYAPRLYCLVAVPLTATVVGIMMWTSAAPGWRGVMTRRAGVRLPFASAFCVGIFTVTVLTVAAVITFAGNTGELGIPGPGVGEPEFRGVYSLAVMPTVVFLIAGVTYGLAALTTVAVAIVINIAAASWSLLVAGDTLADSALWFSAFWGWTDIAATHVEHWLLIWLLSASLGSVSIALVRIRARRLRS
jgi:hypothetical protein